MHSPFPHFIIEDVLEKRQLRQLQAAFKKLAFERKEADLFSFSQSHDLYTVKDKTIEEFLKFLRSKELHDKITQLTGVKTRLGKVDASAFIYEPGDYLLCHDDGISSRKIAYIFYLNSLNVKQGGALALFSAKNNKPAKKAKRILPKENTLILFPVTRTSHHEVEEVLGGKRMTITGWFHD
jgi:Rps23 Pro-64 3,4-dihydroxylase Tpa1-like proline 4-hydroxylase